MLLSARHVIAAVLALVAAVAATAAVLAPAGRMVAIAVAASALTAAVALLVLAPRRGPGRVEPEEIGDLAAPRRAELIRGTSKYLREMRYRYSVRVDRHAGRERPCFTAEVNTVRLGFVPALVTDNTNDRQGYGYVAFVYDQRRWRGPGLPCPAGQAEAVRHASRCVSPLATEEETRY